ncbi:nitrogen permease regulator of amino acid transport activity 3-domain-containing protein [Naematelia encephala]|uniref:Nitrogen permease regulator 3 n=1 Tax=Naematelia encephala TaxID=71784 RepID=A0A1Y2BE72_9TREE|nr:nitrogen permease regulator of amino acid transport activity 3-domain-containing protein [Naematelia encephala]
MAENILGILLVTSSSRGRSVFRYPPDATSPSLRLSQPIYPSATYTTIDPDVEPVRKHLFPPDTPLDGSDHRGSNPSSKGVRLSRASRDGPPDESHISLDRLARAAALNGDGSGSDSYEEDADMTNSENSDDDYEWLSESHRPSLISETALPLGASSNGKINDEKAASDPSRRASASSDLDRKPPGQSGGRKRMRDRFIESQYNYSLNYSLDFLGDMLTPPRAACNRKFEMCVDELVFIGHPVSAGPDGKWSYSSEVDDEDDRPTRGRGRRMREGASHLGTLVEGQVAKHETERDQHSQGPQRTDDDTPSLNMFHLVLIMDKPDPKPGASVADSVVPLSLYDEVYREIAFKWTAAAFALQVRDNFIAKQAWKMWQLREKCINEGVPIAICEQLCYERCVLDRTLSQLYFAIRGYQDKPANPLYSYLPTTLTVSLDDIPISMVLSPRSSETDEAWAHWGEMDDASDTSSLSSGDTWDRAGTGVVPALLGDYSSSTRQSGLRVHPWQTLLLIDDDAVDKALEISTALVGLGLGAGITDETGTLSTLALESRRGSKETSLEEDEGLLIKTLIEACDVTKPLADIAHNLRFDLEAIVIPLARELVQNKKAILIDIINPRLRTIVMPTTIVEHTASLEDYTLSFANQFPSLPPLPALISQISASPQHFRELLPGDLPMDNSERQTYMDALVWLLKQDLVVQVHTRARIFARPEVKRKAWLKLWHRRRERWLKAQSQKPTEYDNEEDDLITPRAAGFEEQSDPLNAVTVPPPRMEQSYMDYDPDLEMDSDVGENDLVDGLDSVKFSKDLDEPELSNMPRFEGSFIFKPGRAQKDEMRWLRIIRETADELTASKFDLCVQYFDGVTTFEEVAYRTGLGRRELERLLQTFKDDVSA